MQNTFDAIVIGAGPAGCQAAAFISRCKWKTLLIDKGTSSGYLENQVNVNYFPGFDRPISGMDLVARMKKQAEIEGAHFLRDTVTAVAEKSDSVIIMTDSHDKFIAKTIVVSIGAAIKSGHLDGEKKFWDKGVFDDAISNAPSVSGRACAVVGKNEHAIDEAIFLSRFAKHVHFIIPSSKLDAPNEKINVVKNKNEIELHFSTSLKRINGTEDVHSISVLSSGREKDIEVAGVFTYIHEYSPPTSFLDKTLELADNGAVKVDNKFTTSIHSVFACGDVICGMPQMPIVSASHGILAGLQAVNYLTTLDKYKNHKHEIHMT